jgi:hypothetical protein
MICYSLLIAFCKLSRSFCHILLDYFNINLLLYSLCAADFHLTLDDGTVILGNRFVALRALIFQVF